MPHFRILLSAPISLDLLFLHTLCVSLYLLQPGRGRLKLLDLWRCTLTVDQLVDLICHVSPPYGRPRIKMVGCKLIHGGEAPGECPATPDEQPVCVTDFVIGHHRFWNTELTLAELEAVTHRLSVKTLTLEVSYDPSKHQTFTQC